MSIITNHSDKLEEKIKTLDTFGNGYKTKDVSGIPIRFTPAAFLIVLDKWAGGWWAKFGWSYRMPGVGLNENILIYAAVDAKPIFIIDSKTLEVYVADPRMILTTCKGWIGGYARGNVPILGIPKKMLARYHAESVEELHNGIRETNMEEDST